MSEDLIDYIERNSRIKHETVKVMLPPPVVSGQYVYFGGEGWNGIALPRDYGGPSGRVMVFREAGKRCVQVHAVLNDFASLTLTATVPELRAIAAALLSAAADIEGDA